MGYSSLILFSVSMCTAVFLIKNYREKLVFVVVVVVTSSFNKVMFVE